MIAALGGLLPSPFYYQSNSLGEAQLFVVARLRLGKEEDLP